MSEKQIKESRTKSRVSSLKSWLEAKPYWEQNLWRLHLEKDVLTDADIEMCYQYLLEDCGVVKTAPGRAPIVFSTLDLSESVGSGAKSSLDKIENLKDINAIDDECVIEFGNNLTIIYGDNGSGKSGIGRLLSNACLSRKPRKLLPNARKVYTSVSQPGADFHVTDATGSSVIKYKLGQTHPALKAFSVYDHECALIHLNSENEVEFVPAKIQIFDKVFKSISVIEMKLQKEVEVKKYENPTEGVFRGISPITIFLDSLSYKTTDKEIEDILKFVSTDKTSLSNKKKEVAKKLKQDVVVQKTALQDECHDLETFKNMLTTKGMILSVAKATQINAVLKEIREKKDIVEKLSVKNFEFAAFKHVGSPEWKSFIIAAQRLYEKEAVSSGGAEPKHCLLCRQSTTGVEKSLFGEYWKFLKSTAEVELATARTTLASHLDSFERAVTSWPAFSNTEVAVKILKKEASADLKKIKTSFDELNTQRQDWISKIKKELDVVYTDPKIGLYPISKLIVKKKKTESKLVDPTAQINKLNGEIEYLEQKQQASRLIVKIKKYVEWLRWQSIADGINLSAVRGATTRKKTDIMGEIVISQYVDIFNKETERLDCKFGLKIESHGQHAITKKGLKLEFARGYKPSDILSDGEQTVSALADFLTEAKLDKKNSGIIFDDPVTSLDHQRKSTIARRLVEEAGERQVVILTHDIEFLLELQYQANLSSTEPSIVSMRKVGDSPGLIKPELPWIALNVKQKTAYLRNDLVTLKKTESGDPDEYYKRVKLWYEMLRESWERAVEERLFKGVVQRFNMAVQTMRLKKLEVTDALVKEVVDGMTESSKWLHDMASGVNPAVPNTSKLGVELQKLDDFITKCKPD